MKNLFLLLLLIPLSLCKEWEETCFVDWSVICQLNMVGPFYVYNCICHPDGLLWSLPFDYKLMKQCNGKNNEEAHCYQNNIYSPEVYCECRKKY